jgi:signal transduction histidine kinase
MSLLLGQIFSLLTVPPGNLVYHIVLAFSIAGALQGAIQHWRTSGFPQARRAVVGLLILLVLQIVLFAVSGLGWQGLLDPQVALPPLDRVVTLLSLVWIAWLWAFPEPIRLADSASILLSLLGLTLFGLTYVFNVQAETGGFNLSLFEVIWQAFGVAVALLGILGLFLRKPNGWGNGLAMLILAFIGHLCSLIWRLEGDFAGILRLAHLVLYPVLLTLPQRFPVPTERQVRPPVKVEGQEEQPARPERRRYSTDPKTFQSMMSLAGEVSSEKIGQALTRAVAQAMLADLCFLFTVDAKKELSIACGYDLIREESLSGAMVDKDALPLLANAIQRGRPLRLPASSTSSDLQGLGRILGLSNAGHLLSVPVVSPERGPMGSILILSPYSNRLWSAEDQAYLSNVAPLFLPVLERSEHIAALELERDKARREVQLAQTEALEARNRLEETLKELETLREKVGQSGLQAENMAALLVMQEESQRLIEQLQNENEQLRNSGAALPGASEQMERELRQTLEEMARMQNALAQANVRILELENRPASPISNEQAEVIASIAQELRQPMSSIVGYTDLLLGESVGILGALQRKFIERIKASNERMGGLVDDLIQITNIETRQMIFRSEVVDLNLIIDNAMAYTSTQIREKNISLHLDIPESLPDVQTDRDALQQVLIHLLQNATVASRVEGTIALRVQIQQEDNKNYLSLQVTDSGGGISPEDLPKVFMRRYRAEHSLIQGVGDTSVGLSIAQALVEAQKGRIWVETEAGVGSTFSVILPVSLEGPQEGPDAGREKDQ